MYDYVPLTVICASKHLPWIPWQCFSDDLVSSEHVPLMLFQLLRPDVRRDYLTKISGFLNTDNIRNWRFREELAGFVVISGFYTK